MRETVPKENASDVPQAVKAFLTDSLPVRVYRNARDLSRAAAVEASAFLRDTLNQQSNAAAILATGNSQIAFLERLVALGEVNWARVTLFHMDEYLGLSSDHPASFRRYMRERVERLVRPRSFHYLEGDAWEPLTECERYAKLLRTQPIDLCCLGIGENGHLAFNDPPVANFDDPRLVKVVRLDEDCRRQQANEGHFPSLEAVPQFAITLTIPALCSASKMICICPEKRKNQAVRDMLRNAISTDCPASVLRRRSNAVLYLDEDSASSL